MPPAWGRAASWWARLALWLVWFSVSSKGWKSRPAGNASRQCWLDDWSCLWRHPALQTCCHAGGAASSVCTRPRLFGLPALNLLACFPACLCGTCRLFAGLALSVTLASLVAVAALMVYVRRQRVQLALLQRERSTYSFSDFAGGGNSSFGGKLASLHTFSAAGNIAGVNTNGPGAQHKTPVERVKTLTIPNPWAEEQGGYIQVCMCWVAGGPPGWRCVCELLLAKRIAADRQCPTRSLLCPTPPYPALMCSLAVLPLLFLHSPLVWFCASQSGACSGPCGDPWQRAA